MFQNDVTNSYTLKDATLEIVIMLVVAFILGYLLHFFAAQKTSTLNLSNESTEPFDEIKKLKIELEKCIEEKATIKKSLTIQYSTQIDELKEKLSSTRADLENCLTTKANSKNISGYPKMSIINSENDDLKKIEGIGPSIAKTLNQANIFTYQQLANCTEEILRSILNSYGTKYKFHNPSSWPQQAELAANEKWEELNLLQKKLNS